MDDENDDKGTVKERKIEMIVIKRSKKKIDENGKKKGKVEIEEYYAKRRWGKMQGNKHWR